MRKYSWLVAICAIFALVFAGFISCDNGNGDGTVATGATTAVTISEIEFDGAAVPTAGLAAPHTIKATDQFTGTVDWEGTLHQEHFGERTVYTATVTLTAKEGFTFTGVAANFFKVGGVQGTNAAGSRVVTVVFPETAGECEFCGLDTCNVICGTSIFTLAGYLTTNAGNTAISEGRFTSGAPRPIRFSSSSLDAGNLRHSGNRSPNIVNGSIYVEQTKADKNASDYAGMDVGAGHGMNLFISNMSSGDLNLDIENKIYTLTVTGSFLEGTPAGVRMRVSTNLGNQLNRYSALATGGVENFIISFEIPADAITNPPAAVTCLRIRSDTYDFDYRIDSIQIVERGNR